MNGVAVALDARNGHIPANWETIMYVLFVGSSSVKLVIATPSEPVRALTVPDKVGPPEEVCSVNVTVLPATAFPVAVSVNFALTVAQSEYCPVVAPLYTRLVGRELIVTVCVQVLAFPFTSVTVHFTVVVPIG